MRQISLLIAALVIAASPAHAAADWQEYVYPGDAFAVQFPAPPTLRVAPYESSIASGLSANVYSLEFENILFEATVVDLDGLIEEGANFVGEAAYVLQRAGEVIFNDFPRVGLRGNGTHGTAMVVDSADGRRIRSSFYVTNGRFYKIDAIVLPARGDLDQIVPSRFDQTLRFNIDGR